MATSAAVPSATGAANKEIAQELHLSPRTAEGHLVSVYLKLNISSKSELRRRRSELDPAGT